MTPPLSGSTSLTSSPTTPIETHYVIDTHVLIWYLAEPTKLSARAKEILEASERDEAQIIIPAIVLAELYFWNGKFKVFADFRKLYEELRSQSRFDFVSFEPHDVLDFEANASVPEMHDRIIAGLAKRLNVPLLTADPLVHAAGITKLAW